VGGRDGKGRRLGMRQLAALALSLALPGCLSGRARAPAGTPSPPRGGSRGGDVSGGEVGGLFVDEYPRSGISFVLGHGGRTPLNIRETLGHGAAMLDADGDGRLDLLFLGPDRVVLYRNLGDWRFADVTAGSGLAQQGYWQGVATGDVDGDGRVDLYLCGHGVQALYRNRGGGRFADVTAASGLAASGGGAEVPWNTSAAFADVDGDGWLDLYVGRYVRFGPQTPQLCDTDQPGVRSVCPPKVYEPQRGVLFRNQGGRRFRDETLARGLATAHGNALGVAFGDEDDDGWPDLAVANDELPGDLFHNRGGGRFANVGAASGTAYDADGRVHAGMGVDWGDLDNDGRLDLAVTTFWGEADCLYRNDGGGLFHDIAGETELARIGRPYVGFGVKFFDQDNDGDNDLVTANGHVADNADRLRRGDRYSQPTLLFRNDGGRFHDITAAAGPAFIRPIVGRAVCAGDLDDDGRLDLVITNLEGPPLLLRNRSEPRGHWLEVSLMGAPPNRQAIGARVTVRAGQQFQVREVTTAGSYLSAGDVRLHFGLGADGDGASAAVDEITVRWPSRNGAAAHVTRRRHVAADRRITLSER
jgi:enediyne biosynthesis protein E4